MSDTSELEAVEVKSRCDIGAGRFGVRGVADAEPLPPPPPPPPRTTRRGVDGGSTHKRGLGLCRQHVEQSNDDEGLQLLLSAVQGELARCDSSLSTLSSAYRSCAGAISHTDGAPVLSIGVHGLAGGRTGVKRFLGTVLSSEYGSSTMLATSRELLGDTMLLLAGESHGSIEGDCFSALFVGVSKIDMLDTPCHGTGTS